MKPLDSRKKALVGSGPPVTTPAPLFRNSGSVFPPESIADTRVVKFADKEGGREKDRRGEKKGEGAEEKEKEKEEGRVYKEGGVGGQGEGVRLRACCILIHHAGKKQPHLHGWCDRWSVQERGMKGCCT